MAGPQGRSAQQTTQLLMDSAVLAAFRVLRRRQSPAEVALLHEQAVRAVAVYTEAGWLDAPALAHPAPPPPSPEHRTVLFERAGGQPFEHLSFPSSYRPHPADPSSPRWWSFEANRRAHAWVLRHVDPRPWLVCVHGAAMGRPRSDLQLFRAAHLHHTLGLNVAMPILPLHGPRRSRGLGAFYPSENVLHNLHGALQGVADVRSTVAWIREQDPAALVAVHGISLGGYTTALVASLEDGLACAILGVAPVGLVPLVEGRGRGRGRRDPVAGLRAETLELGRTLTTMVSPLALEPRLPRERRFMYAGATDRLVDFDTQVAPMVEHWEHPETLVYDGGHVGLGMGPRIPRFIDHALAVSGLLPPSAR